MYKLFPTCGKISVAFALLVALATSAQTPSSGIVKPFSDLKFPPDEDVNCLRFELETGDLDKGASTAIMEATPNCVVPGPLSHCCGATDDCSMGVATGNGRDVDCSPRSGWFRHDAQQACALVHLLGERGMPDVCDV
jgi:hypothetical protein